MSVEQVDGTVDANKANANKKQSDVATVNEVLDPGTKWMKTKRRTEADYGHTKITQTENSKDKEACVNFYSLDTIKCVS